MYLNLFNIIKSLICVLIFKKKTYILIAPRHSRFGNHLYFYLHLYIERNKGRNIYIYYNEDMEYWCKYFPKLSEFIIKDNDISKLFIKIKTETYLQKYGIDFTKDYLNSFIEYYLLEDLIEVNNKNDLIINIRRGDFYNIGNIKKYGFNQIEYIQNALQLFKKDSISSIGVVCDDVNWCKENLFFLEEFKTNVIFYDNIPIENFLTIINAKNLIIPNSTFSFWGAYIKEYINNEGRIIAPNFNNSYDELFQKSEKWELIKVNR